MKKSLNPNHLAIVAAMAAFLMVPGISHACAVTAASPLPYVVSAAGVTGTVTLSAPAGCPWTFPTRGASWIRILSRPSGSGSAVVTYQILPNTSGRARAAAFGPEGVGSQSIGTRTTLAASTGFTISLTQNAH